jgi:hypothetical protein
MGVFSIFYFITFSQKKNKKRKKKKFQKNGKFEFRKSWILSLDFFRLSFKIEFFGFFGFGFFGFFGFRFFGFSGFRVFHLWGFRFSGFKKERKEIWN